MTVEGDPREPRGEEEASTQPDASDPGEAAGQDDAAEVAAPADDQPGQGGDQPDAPQADAAATEAGAEEPTAAEGDAAPTDADAEGSPEERARPVARRGEGRPEQRRQGGEGQPEVVPGADLEPDLVLESADRPSDEYEDAYAARYAEPEAEPEPAAEAAEQAPVAEERPRPRTPMDLAADARYQATGKRKRSVARVILRPGSGTYTVNGRPLDQFFPRHGLRATARQPLVAAGYEARMDVVARLHGGGVSSQAGALRHGIARALVEADPALRGDLKRRGYLTRDPRVKERKKAGLKKARKRPQFSKR